MQLKDTEYELEGSRERVQQQATEILHKASKTRFWAFSAIVCMFMHDAVNKNALPCPPWALDCWYYFSRGLAGVIQEATGARESSLVIVF